MNNDDDDDDDDSKKTNMRCEAIINAIQIPYDKLHVSGPSICL